MENKTALTTQMKKTARVSKLSFSVLRENVLLRENSVMDTKIAQTVVMKTNIVVSERTLTCTGSFVHLNTVSWNTCSKMGVFETI